MNGDALELSRQIGENHADLKEDIGRLATAFAEHKGNIDARVLAIEDDKKTTENRQWYHSIAVTAFGLLHHELLSRFGWKL
jgi:hypothetical protein